MTGNQVAALMAEWGPLVRPFFSLVAAPGRHGAHRAAPVQWRLWDAADAESDAGNSARLAESDRPDFGIRFARGFVAACRAGRVPRRRRCGLLRRQRGGLRWICHAIRYLERREGLAGFGAAALSPPQSAVAGAIAIDSDPVARALLRRLLLFRGAEPGPVARVLERDAAAVAAYQALFWDVGDRVKEPFRFYAALQLGDEEDLKGMQQGGDARLPPLAECAGLDSSMGPLHCGLVFEGHAAAAGFLPDAADAADLMDCHSAWRVLLLHADASLLQGKVVGDALSKFNKVHLELREVEGRKPLAPEMFSATIGHSPTPDSEESAPEPSPASVPLALVDLIRMAGLWQQCAPAASPQRNPASPLQTLWRKSDEPQRKPGGFPAEMSRPDFGSLLAKRVAAAGRSGELPAGAAFHWIRVMAAGLEQEVPAAEGGMEEAGIGDAGDAALRQAVELHASGSSRQLLQAALVTRDAEIGDVADFLGLDKPVVDAYAALFFNLPARRRESSFLHNIEALIQAGLDPLDGGVLPAGRGLAAEMRAVAGISLDDLRRLLGFRAADSRAVDAANRLLELLVRVARGGGRPGEGRGSGSPGKARLESAIRLAAERINSDELGMASSMMDAFASPDFQRAYRKALKANQRQVSIMTAMDEGQTAEEAELNFQQMKRGRPNHEQQEPPPFDDEDSA